MLHTPTSQPLFIRRKTAAELFEKEAAAIARMPDDDKRWPAQVLSELHKQLPFMSKYDVDIEMTRIEPESGYALGYAMLRNKTGRTRVEEQLGKATNKLRVPVIVADRLLQPFHVFEIGGKTYPLTQDRVESAMMNPAMFDGASDPPGTQSLLDQIYPPFQHRQGYGMMSGDRATTGLSKLSSAPTKAAGLISPPTGVSREDWTAGAIDTPLDRGLRAKGHWRIANALSGRGLFSNTQGGVTQDAIGRPTKTASGELGPLREFLRQGEIEKQAANLFKQVLRRRGQSFISGGGRAGAAAVGGAVKPPTFPHTPAAGNTGGFMPPSPVTGVAARGAPVPAPSPTFRTGTGLSFKGKPPAAARPPQGPAAPGGPVLPAQAPPPAAPGGPAALTQGPPAAAPPVSTRTPPKVTQVRGEVPGSSPPAAAPPAAPPPAPRSFHPEGELSPVDLGGKARPTAGKYYTDNAGRVYTPSADGGLTYVSDGSAYLDKLRAGNNPVMMGQAVPGARAPAARAPAAPPEAGGVAYSLPLTGSTPISAAGAPAAPGPGGVLGERVRQIQAERAAATAAVPMEQRVQQGVQEELARRASAERAAQIRETGSLRPDARGGQPPPAQARTAAPSEINPAAEAGHSPTTGGAAGPNPAGAPGPAPTQDVVHAAHMERMGLPRDMSQEAYTAFSQNKAALEQKLGQKLSDADAYKLFNPPAAPGALARFGQGAASAAKGLGLGIGAAGLGLGYGLTSMANTAQERY